MEIMREIGKNVLVQMNSTELIIKVDLTQTQETPNPTNVGKRLIADTEGAVKLPGFSPHIRLSVYEERNKEWTFR